MRKSFFRAAALLFLSALLLGMLSACAQSGDSAGAPSTEPLFDSEIPAGAPTAVELTSENTDAPETEAVRDSQEPGDDPLPAAETQLETLREWMGRPKSYEIEMRYDYIPLFGFANSFRQLYGADESFRFTTAYSRYPGEERAAEDDETLWVTEQLDWYYCYVDGVYTCYTPDGLSGPVDAGTKAEMEADNERICGASSLLPEGLLDFTEAEGQDPAGIRVFTYRIPVSAVLDSGSIVSVFLNACMQYSAYAPATLQPLEELTRQTDLCVSVRLEAESDSLRPLRAVFDFTELKPYLFGDGPLSAEYALDMDVMTMTAEYDFDLPPAVAQDAVLDEGFLNSAPTS